MMRFKTVAIPAAVLSLVLMSGAAYADDDNGRSGNGDNGLHGDGNNGDNGFHGEGNNGNGGGNGGGNSGFSDVPELSLGASGAAFVLLAGGTLVARGRRRRVEGV